MSEKIIDFLNRAARQYYNGTPIITDEQFDSLADSVGYNRVGAKQHENVEKHFQRMFSLEKHYEDEGEAPFANIWPKNSEVSVTPKLDGAAVSLLYVENKLVRVLTRGDGIEGRVVTDKFLATSLVPHTLPASFKSPIVQITGEVAAPKHVENSRNYAAGALNLGSVEEFKSRAVDFFAYGVFPFQSDTFTYDMRALMRAGFKTVNDKGLTEVYPTDGAVLRLDSNKLFESMGFTSKHPKGAFALKERSEAVVTTLLGVEWNVGRTGRVTPVALLEPVLIGDALVSRATLNNPGFIEALDLQIGDKVAVVRSGEIIPCITHKVE